MHFRKPSPLSRAGRWQTKTFGHLWKRKKAWGKFKQCHFSDSQSESRTLLQTLNVTLCVPHKIAIWVWVNTYRYIFSGMNIHKSQLFWGSLGTRVLTHPHIFSRDLRGRRWIWKTMAAQRQPRGSSSTRMSFTPRATAASVQCRAPVG